MDKQSLMETEQTNVDAVSAIGKLIEPLGLGPPAATVGPIDNQMAIASFHTRKQKPLTPSDSCKFHRRTPVVLGETGLSDDQR